MRSAKGARFRQPGATRKRKLLIAGGASAALAAAVLSAGAASAGAASASATSAGAASAPKPAAIFTGTIASAPASSSRVIVEAELTLGKNTKTSSARLEDEAVATATVHGSRFSVPVPRSAVLARAGAASHGVVNYRVIVVSGSKMTAMYVPAPHSVAVAAAKRSAGTASAAAAAATYTVHVPRLPAFRPMSAAERAALPNIPVPPPCVWTPIGALVGDPTRIGEVHVANASGVSDTFENKIQNDETISVAVSDSPTSNYTFGGSITLSNSLSITGGQTFGSGTVQYADTTGYYQRYQADSATACGSAYKIQMTSTGGDVFHGTNTPGVNPWGGCQGDQLRVVLQPGASWARDQSKAMTYSGVATFYNFSFTGTDGFTTDVQHDYVASSGASQTTYICGTKAAPTPSSSPILYNTP